MTTQNQTYTVKVTDGPGSELIMLSLHCLLRNEKTPILTFKIGDTEESLQLVITEVGAIECIEGAHIQIKGAHPRDVCRFCPPRQREREEREFVFTNYNHHTRKGFMQIPSAYVAHFKDVLVIR